MPFLIGEEEYISNLTKKQKKDYELLQNIENYLYHDNKSTLVHQSYYRSEHDDCKDYYYEEYDEDCDEYCDRCPIDNEFIEDVINLLIVCPLCGYEYSIDEWKFINNNKNILKCEYCNGNFEYEFLDIMDNILDIDSIKEFYIFNTLYTRYIPIKEL